MADYVTVKRAVEELGLSPQMIYRLINEGDLDARKVKAKWLITRESLQAEKELRRLLEEVDEGE